MNPWNDRAFMDLADEQQKKSTCIANQWGAVLVKDGLVIGSGKNGHHVSAGHECSDGVCQRCLDRKNGLIKSGENLGACVCTHAEAEAIENALYQNDYFKCTEDDLINNNFGYSSSRYPVDPRHATLYTQGVPCVGCAKFCVKTMVARVVVKHDNYPKSGASLLRKAGIRIDVIGDV